MTAAEALRDAALKLSDAAEHAAVGEHSPAITQIVSARATLTEAEHAIVADARAAGATWADIGEIYGTSRQSAQKRFTP